MKSAECPLGVATGVRLRMPPPLVLPEHVHRAIKLLAIAIGFVCGCRLGIMWTSGDASHEIMSIVGKCAFLAAGPLVLGRRPARRGYERSGGRT
jgi:hypothetical protein